MKKHDAYGVYLSMQGFTAFLFAMIFTASSVYQVTVAGLTPLQLVLVGTTLEFFAFTFEVPTGVIADVYSRRLSIIIGMFVMGIGFMIEGSFPIFGVILLAQIFWAIGYTFTSGATQAWITDEIGEAAAGKAFLRSNQMGNLAAVLGIGAGMALGNLRVSIPIQLGGLGLIMLGFLLVLVMPETGFAPTPQEDRNSWQSMAYTFREGLKTVRNRPTLMTILAIGLVYGLYSEGLDRLWTKHLLDNFVLPWSDRLQPVVWIGLIHVIGLLMAVGVTEVAQRRVDTQSHTGIARALFFISVVLVASLFAFALAGTFALAVVFYWIVDIARNVIGPIYTAWVNQRLDSRVRATVLSMSSQVDAIGQVAGGPVVGLIGNLLSVRAALLTSSLILTPILALYSRIIRKGDKVEPEPVALDLA